MNEKIRLIKNTGLIALGNFGAKLISFLLLPLYTSILTTEEYGTYDFIVAVSAFLFPIATMAMHEAMFRFIIDTGNKGEHYRRIICNALVTVIAGISVQGIILSTLQLIFGIDNCLYIWLYTASTSLYNFSNNMLRGLGKIKEYAIVSSCKNILQLIVNVVAVVFFRWGLHGLLFSLCITETAAFLVVAFLSKIWNAIKLKYISVKQIKNMLKYSLPLIPNALSAQIINLSDRVVISTFMGPSANGIYSVSYKFPNIVETVYHYFYTAWSESAARVFGQGKEKATKYYQSLYDIISNLMFAVIILMIAGMPIMFRIFVRGDYVQGFDYIWILLLAMYFDCLAKFYSGLFTALKKTNVMAVSTLIAAAVNLVVNLCLIKWIGLYAAAGSTLLADMVLVMLRRKFAVKDIEIKISWKKTVAQIIVAIIVVILVDYDNWFRISVSIVIVGIYSVISNLTTLNSVFKVFKRKVATG